MIGKATGTNPTSGSGRWTGVMVGVDVSDTINVDNRIQGDAEIRIRRLPEPGGGRELYERL